MKKCSNKDEIRIIYIAGYGYSGSTILEILLSCSEEIVGLGEFVRIPDELGASFTQTFLEKKPFCNEIYQRVENTLKLENESLRSITELNRFENIFSRNRKELESRYHRFWSTFMKAAKNEKSKNIVGFVDSSKTSVAHALRPYELNKIDGINVTIVHLIRHPQAILGRPKNKNRQSNKREEPKWNSWDSKVKHIFKTTLNWIFSNIWPALLSHKVDKYVRISFEELCEFPVKTLKKIEKNCDLDLNETIERIINNSLLPPTCGIAGNIPVKKHEDKLRFQPSKKALPKTGFFLSILSLFLVPIYKMLTR